MAEWIDRMRGIEIASVAGELGYQVRPSGSSITVSPCPACKAEKRHEGRGDKRGAVGIRRRTPGGWCCHACGSTGDALHFVALHFTDRRFGDLDDHDRAKVREWSIGFAGGACSSAPRPTARAPVVHEPIYPPSEELRAVWRASWRVPAVRAVAQWLRSARGLSPAVIEQRNLARVAGDDCPEWSRFGSGRTYVERGYRLLLPMFNHEGRARSLIFRRTHETGGGPKSVPPRGYERSGLVMATAGARGMLRGLLEEPAPLVIVAEGEMDFLAWASSSGAIVLGIVSGSWTPEIAARIPDGARVVIATDADEQGEKYAAKIRASLRGRVELERWRSEKDANDTIRAGGRLKPEGEAWA